MYDMWSKHMEKFFHFNKSCYPCCKKTANTLFVKLKSGIFVVITIFSCQNKESLLN